MGRNEPPFELQVEKHTDGLRALARAMKAESDGKALKRDLAKRLRGTLDPLRARVIARLMAIPSQGHAGEGMREAIARQVRAGVRFSGRNTGVNLVQRARGMPRGFNYAGRAFNRAEGWNPTALGGVTIEQQARPVAWFDDPVQEAAESGEYRKEVLAAMEDMAARIASRAK